MHHFRRVVQAKGTGFPIPFAVIDVLLSIPAIFEPPLFKAIDSGNGKVAGRLAFYFSFSRAS